MHLTLSLVLRLVVSLQALRGHSTLMNCFLKLLDNDAWLFP